MIRPHLDYIDFIIDSSSADRIQKLDNLQKKAVRRIEYCPNPDIDRTLKLSWKNITSKVLDFVEKGIW